MTVAWATAQCAESALMEGLYDSSGVSNVCPNNKIPKSRNVVVNCEFNNRVPPSTLLCPCVKRIVLYCLECVLAPGLGIEEIAAGIDWTEGHLREMPVKERSRINHNHAVFVTPIGTSRQQPR